MRAREGKKATQSFIYFRAFDYIASKSQVHKELPFTDTGIHMRAHNILINYLMKKKYDHK